MANQTFMTLVNGLKTMLTAISSSAGAGDAGKIPCTDSAGRLDSTLMPVGIVSETDLIVCSENLAAGNLVNIYTNAGAANCRKADATAAGKEANGFVLAAFTSGQTATVYRPSQSMVGLTGLTPGSLYFLTTTAGSVSTTAPSTSGNVIQSVGRAVSATAIAFMPGEPVTLA